LTIKTHKALADLIAGKRILHSNSLGKDSVLALAWLCEYAAPSEVISVHFEFLAKHPDDARYLQYLRARFPNVSFITEPNPIELTLIIGGVYQNTEFMMRVGNKSEYVEFEMGKQIQELKTKYQCDYVCDGSSKYETFARRTKFHQKGLEFNGTISPLGMMSRAEVIGAIKASGIKLHPVYKFARSTMDHPSWYKMRSNCLANPEYWQTLKRFYPLLVLDKFRYERMLLCRS
jgi:3'-phosphoadenosine 5'-phosphosulfate sulfotransferase (PAPS reductase)/FAD synthetase